MAGLYDPIYDAWPDLKLGRIVLAPVSVGMDRSTGKMIVGWDHVVQSVLMIFLTRFHERVLRRWVGSFVPHILGESATPRVITRFYWAIATSIELWEPRYLIRRIRQYLRQDGSSLTRAEELRTGTMTHQTEGVYRPRGHLGDFTSERRRTIGLVQRGQSWSAAA